MSDPDLYSDDPWRRYAAQERLKAKNLASNNNAFASKPKPSSTSKSNEIDPEAAGAAMAIAALGMAAIAAAAAATAAVTIKVTYDSIRWGLNKKDGLDQKDDTNNIKAGWLTAGFFLWQLR